MDYKLVTPNNTNKIIEITKYIVAGVHIFLRLNFFAIITIYLEIKIINFNIHH